MPKISAVIITLNEEKNIARCLQSLQGVAAEIVVVDSGSTDRTAEICRQFGARFIHQDWLGFGRQKNFAVTQASHNWVLNIDADEALTPELADEISGIFSAPTEPPFAAYKIPTVLYFFGREFTHGTESRLLRMRLFNRERANFNAKDIHEGVEFIGGAGEIGELKNKALHHSYRDLAHYLEKHNTYTDLAARERYARGKRPSAFGSVFSLLVNFFNIYFIRRNFLNGGAGLIWAWLCAYANFIRSAKIMELAAAVPHRLPILMYHHVAPESPGGLMITPQTLEQHFAYLQVNGYTPIFFRDLLSGEPLPSKPIIITFDDGYQDNAEYLFPLLEKYALKVSIALVPKYIGGTSEWDGAAARPLMDVATLKNAPSGRVEYVMHSFAHLNCRKCDLETIRADLTAAFAEFNKLAIDYTPVLVYPFGKFPRKVLSYRYREFCAILKELGIVYGVRIGRRINQMPFKDNFLLCRIIADGRDSLSTFKKKLRKGRD